MSDLSPADLAKFIHPVPVGATIPAGVEFVRHYKGGDGGPSTALVGPLLRDFDYVASAGPHWTAEPIPAPLPTEPGSIIADVCGASFETIAVMVLSGRGRWCGVDDRGLTQSWTPGYITAWTPARIVTDESGLMNENDKRPRIDSDGDLVVWDGWRWVCTDEFDGRWHAATLAEYCRRFNVTITAFA